MSDDILKWLWLDKIFGTANPRKWEATARFASIDECYDAFTHGDCYGLNEAEVRRVRNTDIYDLDRTLEYCGKNNIKIYCYESEGFPERLKEIYNPPAVIYAKHSGESLDFLNESVVVAVVGARKINDYYIKVTEEIAGQLAAAGIVVASGFAVGADTAAHKAAIKNGGKTAAVLGSGIDYDYPRGTLAFKDEIAENGAVISEFLPDHVPSNVDFIARNRILSGISMGILVTQASPTSGSLNTVSNGVSQGKDIFCVPPMDIFNYNYSGVVQLIRDGAVPVFDAKDVIYEYYENYSHRIDIARNTQEFSQKSEDSSVFTGESKKSRKKPSARSESSSVEKKRQKPKMPDISGLSETQQSIVKALEKGGLLADEISRATGVGIMELFGELTELEIAGVVKSLPGNRYSL